MNTNQELVTHLQSREALKTQRIVEAFIQADRRIFVTGVYINRCYDDTALPIGYNQTISQPTTVAMMLELLQPMKGKPQTSIVLFRYFFCFFSSFTILSLRSL